MQEDKDNRDLHSIDIGNLLPNQTAKVDIVMIQPLTLVAGAYNFVFPTSYVPKYEGPQGAAKQD